MDEIDKEFDAFEQKLRDEDASEGRFRWLESLRGVAELAFERNNTNVLNRILANIRED